MTDDIVKRLRYGLIDTNTSYRYQQEAADEIEKLRTALRESDEQFMRVDKERMKLRAKLQAATGELCDSAAKAALGESDE